MAGTSAPPYVSRVFNVTHVSCLNHYLRNIKNTIVKILVAIFIVNYIKQENLPKPNKLQMYVLNYEWVLVM